MFATKQHDHLSAELRFNNRPRIPLKFSAFSSVFSLWRQPDIEWEMLTKEPLLTLKLSSISFLDSKIFDEMTGLPLYVIKTVGNLTNIHRYDPWGGHYKTAGIRWPAPCSDRIRGRETQDVTVQMAGEPWRNVDSFLKPGSLLSARKFSVPNISSCLKWKRAGHSFQCTSPLAKGVIATLDPAVAASPPRLTIFEIIDDKRDFQPLLLHRGIPVDLLNYLLVTALLLATDSHEWTLLPSFLIKIPESRVAEDNTVSLSASIDSTSTDAGALELKTMTAPKSLSPPLRDELSNAENEEWANLVKASHKFSYTLSPSHSVLDISRCSSPFEYRSEFYTCSNSSAPSHTYLDPSFYGERVNPAIREIPSRLRSSEFEPPIRSDSASSSLSREILPVPAFPPGMEDLRPRSTPPSDAHQTDLVGFPRSSSAFARPTHRVTSSRSSTLSTASSVFRRLPQLPHLSSDTPRTATPTLPRLETSLMPNTASHASALTTPSPLSAREPGTPSRSLTPSSIGTFRLLPPIPPSRSGLNETENAYEVLKRVDKEARCDALASREHLPPPAYAEIIPPRCTKP